MAKKRSMYVVTKKEVTFDGYDLLSDKETPVCVVRTQKDAEALVKELSYMEGEEMQWGTSITTSLYWYEVPLRTIQDNDW